MAGRKFKKGIDYFDLSVHFYENTEYKFVNARCGLQGEAIINRLIADVYHEGYYLEFNDDYALLFAISTGDKGRYGLVKDVVYELLKRGFFDRSIFERFGVLTSKEIQDNYIRVTSERLSIEIIKEYWLVEIPENTNKRKVIVHALDNTINPLINTINRPINTINRPINTINRPINTQRKEEKSKVKKSKESSSSSSRVSNSKSVKSKEEEKEKIALVVKSYLDNISPTPSAIVYEEIKEWLSVLEPSAIIKAIEIAVMNNGRSLNYIKHIVNDWACKGLTTLTLVNAYLEDWERKKGVKLNEFNKSNTGTEHSKVKITEI